MSEETVSLREYFERVIDEREKALQLAFKAQQEALSLAAASINARLEKLNELRQEVVGDRGSYVTKEKQEADLSVLLVRIGALENWKSWVLGAVAVIGLLGGGLGAVVGRFVFK